MQCVSHKISGLLSASAKRAFNFPTIPIEVNATAIDSEYDYSSTISKDLFEKHRSEMAKYWKQDQLFASGIASEIAVQLSSNTLIDKCNVDSLGSLNIKLKDTHLIEGIQQIAKWNHKQFQVDYEDKDVKHAVLFPFGQVAEKPLLNSFRGANIAETMARIQSTMGVKDLVRVGVIQNAQPFHGIIYAYLNEISNGKLDPNSGSLDFAKLAQFIVKQNLESPADIAGFGAKVIESILLNPSEQGSGIKDIMEKLTGAAIGNYQETYSKIAGTGIEIVRGDEIWKSTLEFLAQQTRKGILTKGETKELRFTSKPELAAIDPVGSLTREGFFVGLLRHLEIGKFIQQFHVASGVQDERLYENLAQHLLRPCGINATLNFYTHNDLFSENNKSLSINSIVNYYSKRLITRMSEYYKERYPEIMPNLLEEQSEIFLDQCLGWTRFLDHKKSRKTPYVMSVENVLDYLHKNEKLTNSRMQILEIINSYPKRPIAALADSFTFTNASERTLARILLSFPDVMHKSLVKHEFTPLTEYLELLLSVIDHMKKTTFQNFNSVESNSRSEQEINSTLILLDATNKILHKLFFVSGILNH